MFCRTFQLSRQSFKSLQFCQLQKIESVVQRYGSQWTTRAPSGIANEQVLLEPEEKVKPRKYVMTEDLEHRPLRTRKKHLPPNKRSKKGQKVESDETFKENGDLNIIKYTGSDRKLPQLIVSLRSRKLREKTDRILLEGHRMIQDAIDAQVTPEIIMFSRKTEIEKLSLPKKGVKLYKVPYESLQLWSTLTTSPGIMGVFKTPKLFDKRTTVDTLPVTIICDNVREPGNMGSILRAAAGVGCEKVILTKGCVDVWEPKVLRSAAGAHFRVSIFKSVDWSDIDDLTSRTASVFIADNDAAVFKDNSVDEPNAENSQNLENSSETSIENSEKIAKCHSENSSDNVKESSEFKADKSSDSVQLTNETQNLAKSPESANELENPKLDIESDKLELKDETQNSESTELKDEAQNSGESSKKKNEQEESKLRKVSMKELASRIPVIPYYSANYSTNEVILIVGGETEGLSYESIQMIQQRGGVRVNIPMTNDVESLNTGMALGIIAFEVKRQFTLRKTAQTQ